MKWDSRSTVALAATALGLCMGASRLSAHHAFGAEFDPNLPVLLKGPIVRIEWINPHTWIHLDVKDSSGKVVEWMIEGGTPNTLLRRGVDKNSLPAGTEIVVEGYRAKNGTNRANGRDLTLPNGRKLFLGSSGTGAPSDGKDPSEGK